MNLSLLSFIAGTALGLAYWLLGIAASAHFTDKSSTGADRFFSSGMLWSLNTKRYEKNGRNLCVWGNVVLATAIGAWLAWANLR